VADKLVDGSGPDRDEDLVSGFGSHVRQRRETAGLTLEQLSKRSAVSRAMLSKVERGETSPTSGVATKIAQALDTSLTDLIGAPTASGVTVVMRKSDRPVFRDPDTGFERHIVSAALGAGRIEMVCHYLPAHVSTGPLPASPPGTEKQLVVIRGVLTLAVAGVAERLRAGDSLFFQADAVLEFTNHANTPCEYLMVISRRP